MKKLLLTALFIAFSATLSHAWHVCYNSSCSSRGNISTSALNHNYYLGKPFVHNGQQRMHAARKSDLKYYSVLVPMKTKTSYKQCKNTCCTSTKNVSVSSVTTKKQWRNKCGKWQTKLSNNKWTAGINLSGDGSGDSDGVGDGLGEVEEGDMDGVDQTDDSDQVDGGGEH